MRKKALRRVFRIFILGTYDSNKPEELFEVDLMRYVENTGVFLAGIIYKTTPAFRTNLPLYTPITAKKDRTVIRTDDLNAPEIVSAIKRLKPDLLIYAGGRDILRTPLLNAARLGCIGGHYGHLPDIRGMGTVEWSIIEGVPPTVAIQRINAGIDTGDVLMQAPVPLMQDDTFTSIRERSYSMTKEMLATCAGRLMTGEIESKPQDKNLGRQYYRLHPAIQELAERKLSRLLQQHQKEQRSS
jgi:methionyl-tRNA formyltransferase